MLNKRKATIFILILILLIGTFTYINASSDKNEQIAQSAEKRLEMAYNDIQKSFDLDQELACFRQVSFSEVINNDKGGDVSTEIDLLDQQVPIGSIKPMYFINDNSKEIIILYKAADGTNVMLRSERNDGSQAENGKLKPKWTRTEKKVKGEPILDIGD